MQSFLTLSHLIVSLVATLLCASAVAFAQDAPIGIETDPLAWLNTSLSCNELTDQIKSRYAPLGKFSDLPDAKKEELRHVLEIVCSERFSRCKFKNCQREESADSGSAPPMSDDELVSQAEAQLRSLIADQEKLQKARLEQARKKGGQNTWGRISVPEDKRVREEDQVSSPTRREAREEAQEDTREERDEPPPSRYRRKNSQPPAVSEPPPLIH